MDLVAQRQAQQTGPFNNKDFPSIDAATEILYDTVKTPSSSSCTADIPIEALKTRADCSLVDDFPDGRNSEHPNDVISTAVNICKSGEVSNEITEPNNLITEESSTCSELTSESDPYDAESSNSPSPKKDLYHVEKAERWVASGFPDNLGQNDEKSQKWPRASDSSSDSDDSSSATGLRRVKRRGSYDLLSPDDMHKSEEDKCIGISYSHRRSGRRSSESNVAVNDPHIIVTPTEEGEDKDNKIQSELLTEDDQSIYLDANSKGEVLTEDDQSIYADANSSEDEFFDALSEDGRGSNKESEILLPDASAVSENSEDMADQEPPPPSNNAASCLASCAPGCGAQIHA